MTSLNLAALTHKTTELAKAIARDLSQKGTMDLGLDDLLTAPTIRIDQKKGRLHLDLLARGMSIDHKSQLEQAIISHPNFEALSALAKAHQLKARVNFLRSQPETDDPSNEPDLSRPSKFITTTTPKKSLPNIGAIYCVASGKGGVGKSTVAVHLARLLAQKNLRTGLLDGDIHGPSAAQMLELDGTLEVDARHRLVPLENHGVKCVSFGLLTDDYHPALWRGPLISKALEQFLFDVEWGELDYLIIDLPPGTGDIPMTMAESVAMDGCLVVSTAHEVALMDAHKAISMFQKLGIPIVGVIGNMIHHICTNCGHSSQIFGHVSELTQMCEERSVKLLAELPLLTQNPKMSGGESPEWFQFVGALSEACEHLREHCYESS